MAKAGFVFAKDNEYYTPKEFVKRFGEFDYDLRVWDTKLRHRADRWVGTRLDFV